MAESVLAVPRNDVLALAFAGHASAFVGRDPARGMRVPVQAHALNPNSRHVLNAAGWVHIYADDNETAIDRFNRSIRINALDPIIGQARYRLGIALTQADRVPEVIVTLEQACAEAPEYPTAFVALVWAYWLEGRLDRVDHFGAKMLACDPDMTISGHFNSIPFVMSRRLRTIEDTFRHLGTLD